MSLTVLPAGLLASFTSFPPPTSPYVLLLVSCVLPPTLSTVCVGKSGYLHHNKPVSLSLHDFLTNLFLLLPVGLLVLLNSSLYLWYVIKRAKPCLDYASTIHCLHLLFSWMIMGRFPWSLSWWMINVICLTITCVCGEFLCMRTEMKTIPLLSAMEMESKADV